MEAFHDGQARLHGIAWDFIAKLDGDLSFEPDYFERCLGEMLGDRQIGIAGGTCCVVRDGVLEPEFAGEPGFHVRGPSKIYRRECFERIGGLVAATGWDTIDLVKANMLGWTTRTFAHIHLEHRRPTGGAYGSWANWSKNGLANYITGYHPAFMLCKCLKRALGRPSMDRLKEVLGLAHGYLRGYCQRYPRVGDRAMIRYVRAQQWRALTLRRSLWR